MSARFACRECHKYLLKQSLKPHWQQRHKSLPCPYDDFSKVSASVILSPSDPEECNEGYECYNSDDFEAFGEYTYEYMMDIEGGNQGHMASEGDAINMSRMETYLGAGIHIFFFAHNDY